MNTAQPIKDRMDLHNLKNYYKIVQPNERNSLLICMGLHTALRISDLLDMNWNVVYDFKQHQYRKYIFITEQKTGKTTQIYLSEKAKLELEQYRLYLQKKGKEVSGADFLFSHTNKNSPISRVQAFRIVKNAAEECGISGSICCHSLRKTFGYHAWKQGASPVLLVSIYNHSSYQVTKRYLGIEQEDKDSVFQNIQL